MLGGGEIGIDLPVVALAAQAIPTRPPGYHGSTDRRGDPVAHRGSVLPRRRLPAQVVKRDKGVGPPPTNSPARHPGGDRYHQNLHSDLAAPQHPPLPQREECDGLTG